MADFAIPLEPIHSAPWGAIPYEAGESPAPFNELALRACLEPLELGAYDERIVAWLVLEASTTVATVCSWLERMKEVRRG